MSTSVRLLSRGIFIIARISHKRRLSSKRSGEQRDYLFFLFLPHQSSSRDHHQSGSICEVILLETSNRTLSVQRLSILRGKPLTRRNARLNLPTKSFPLTKPSNHNIVQTIFFSPCQFPSELAINRILSVLGAQYRPKVGVHLHFLFLSSVSRYQFLCIVFDYIMQFGYILAIVARNILKHSRQDVANH